MPNTVSIYTHKYHHLVYYTYISNQPLIIISPFTVTGSGQKEVTRNRVKIYEVEGNTKPNARGKMGWKIKIPQSPQAGGGERKPRPYKRKSKSPKGGRKRTSTGTVEHGYTDEEENEVDNEVASSNDGFLNFDDTFPIPRPNLMRQLSDGDPDFREAISIFRDMSDRLSLSRDNSCQSIMGYYLNDNNHTKANIECHTPTNHWADVEETLGTGSRSTDENKSTASGTMSGSSSAAQFAPSTSSNHNHYNTNQVPIDNQV